MSRQNPKKPATLRGASRAPAQPPKRAPSSQLRSQTRKVLGKHYRSKYGVR